MSAATGLSVAERLGGLLDHLGVRTAHVVLHGFELGWPETVRGLEERVAGLGVFIHPDNPAMATALAPFASRAVVVTGEHRTPAVEEVIQQLQAIPIGDLLVLPGYSLLTWSDVAAERGDALAAGLGAFFSRLQAASVAISGSGEWEGVTYRAGGSGPPLVLFPIGLAPSQWEPVLSALQQRFCTIQLGGPHVGAVAMLEFRARGAYIGAVEALFTAMEPAPGQSVLEAGCGSGALARRLATRYPGVSITGMDVNRYLLGEAESLATSLGLGERIVFREGDATAIPFPDAAFDRVYSSTVMEEVDADRMMAELVRVTKPGGRVAVMTRSVDRPRWVNLTGVSPELRPKLDYISGSVGPGGCADASLYERFPRAGLRDVRIMPQLAVDERTTPAAVEQQLASRLTAEERAELHQALERAVKEGTFFVAATFHAAVGTRV